MRQLYLMSDEVRHYCDKVELCVDKVERYENVDGLYGAKVGYIEMLSGIVRHRKWHS